jgi:hypothetical protein
MFSKDDRNLLIRVGKTIQAQIALATAQASATQPGSAAHKAHKAMRNRLLRDNTDLIALRKRIEKAVANQAAQIPPQSD